MSAMRQPLNMQGLQQRALVELTQAALAGADLSTLMRQATELVARALDVEYSILLVLLPDERGFAFRAGAGWEERDVAPATIGVETTSAVGYALQINAPVIVEDWRGETRFCQPGLLRDHRVRSSLAVVIPGQHGPFGVLEADSRLPRSYTDDDVHFLQAIANVLAMVLQRMAAEASLQATERVEVYQMLEQRVEERTREIERRSQAAEGLRETLTILNSHRPLDEILQHIIAQACRLLGTPSGAIYRLNREAETLTIRASRGLHADDAALNLPARWQPIAQAVLLREPVAVADTAACADFLDRSSTLPQPCLTRLIGRYRALLIVPLIVKDDVYGAIALYYHDPRAFSDDQTLLAGAVSDQAALAIENARLVSAAEGRAVLEERQRLARDLHDSVTQALYGITLYAEAGARVATAGDSATVAGHLRELQEMAQGALQEMRLLIFELRPPELQKTGLRSALQTRLEAVEARSNLQAELIAEELPGLPAAVEQALYRIAQEALNNVLKHAHARHVAVALRRERQAVILEITDDGIGFDPAAASAQGGLGLRGIGERVAQFGGRLDLWSAPGAGTRVRVEVVV